MFLRFLKYCTSSGKRKRHFVIIVKFCITSFLSMRHVCLTASPRRILRMCWAGGDTHNSAMWTGSRSEKKVASPVGSHQEHVMGPGHLSLVALKLWCRFGPCIDHPCCIYDFSPRQRDRCFVPAMNTALEHRYKVRKWAKNNWPGKLVDSVDFPDVITMRPMSNSV